MLLTFRDYLRENLSVDCELILEAEGGVQLKKGAGFSKKHTFKHNGEEHHLEIKNQGEHYGKVDLVHNGEFWDIDKKSKVKYPETSKAITATGVLKKVNQKWKDRTGNFDKDSQAGDVTHTHGDAAPIAAHFGKDKGISYLQVPGSGFYHTGEDKAKLNAPELSGKTELKASLRKVGKQTKASLTLHLKNADKSHYDLDAKPAEKK